MTEETFPLTRGTHNTYVAKHDRYTTIYDEQDYIEDTLTGEYLTLEEACNTLNDQHERLAVLEGFAQTFLKKLYKEDTK